MAYEVPSKNNYATKENYEEYILGPGDTLQLKFKGFDVFNGNFAIQPNGFMNLPEVGKIYAKDKTIIELEDLLASLYKEFIYDPKIELSVSVFRPLSLTLRGEVNKTGLFTLNYEETKIPNTQNLKNSIQVNNNFAGVNKRFNNERGKLVPRLFDLLQYGEGVTSYADLSNIEIVRRNSNLNGGGFIKTNINLISLIESGDQSVNIELRDGDDIFVPRSKKILLDQLLQINKSNLTPDNVDVFVNGNVGNTGRLVLRQGASLSEAIASAGGMKSMTGSIEFIRLNRDGKTEKRIINSNNGKKGTENNPILVSGDIIFVRRNILGRVSNIITEYTSPAVNAYGVYKIFD